MPGLTARGFLFRGGVVSHNRKSPISDLPSLPTFISLADAVRKYKIPEDVLTRLIQDGRIDAVQLPSGELVVSDNDLSQTKTKEQIIREKYGHLRGQAITISRASEKYGVPGTTLRDWIARKYVRVIDADDYPMRIDEAELAFALTFIVSAKAGITRVPLLDENGLPYQLKQPKLHEYRRRKKQERLAGLSPEEQKKPATSAPGVGRANVR